MIQALSEYQFLQDPFAAHLLERLVCTVIGVISAESLLVIMRCVIGQQV